jgi:hypothetical protein
MPPLEVWAKIGESSAVVGVLLAMVGTGWGVWRSVRETRAREREKDIVAWQTATVWEIIAKAGPVNFDTILEKYRTAAIPRSPDKEFRRELESDRLQVILLGLIESRAIHVLPARASSNGGLTYSILRFDPAVADQVVADMALLLHQIEERNGELDALTLKGLESSGKLSGLAHDIDHILLRLETSQLIGRDQHGKYSRRHFITVTIPHGEATKFRTGSSSSGQTDAQSGVAPPRPTEGESSSGFQRPPQRDHRA